MFQAATMDICSNTFEGTPAFSDDELSVSRSLSISMHTVRENDFVTVQRLLRKEKAGRMPAESKAAPVENSSRMDLSEFALPMRRRKKDVTSAQGV